MTSIFQLITSINLGGAENVAFELAESCRQNGNFQCHVVELFRTENAYSDSKRCLLASKGIPQISLSRAGKRPGLLIAPLRLARLLGATRPDIIHSHTDLPDLVLASALRWMNIWKIPTPKIIRTIHNVALWPTHPILARYTESALRDDAVVGVSSAALSAYDRARERFGLTRSSSRQVIYNGCHLPTPQPVPFHLPPGHLQVGFCGRFDHQKGVDILADRIRTLQRIWSGRLAFHLIGAGACRPLLEAVAADSAHVYLHPPIVGVADYLHAFDCMIMPSRFEGLGLVAIEAALAKIPMIATDAPGLRETLPDDWPLKFDLEDESQLIGHFQRILDGTYDLKALGVRFFEHASKKFSSKGMIDAYTKLYTETVSSARTT